MNHVPVALATTSCSVCQLILRPAMRRIISGSFSSSIKGPVFVSLIDIVAYVSITLSGHRRTDDGAHGEHNDADRPAVDEVVVSMGSHTLHDDFRREVVGCSTHRLLGRYLECCTLCNQTTGKETHPEHCETVDRLSETKVGNFDDWWIVSCQKYVLWN